MQLRTILRILLFILVLMAGISASAKVIPPRPLFFDRDITLNGAVVPEGMYRLYLETHGSSVRATLRRDGRFVATARGTWVGHGIKYAENAVLLRVNADGTRALSEIRLAGSAKSIVIDGESSILRVAPFPSAGVTPPVRFHD